MQLQTIAIAGALGLGAWWLYRQHQATPAPAAAATPTAVAGMTFSGAASTQAGPAFARNIGAPTSGLLAAIRTPVQSISQLWRREASALIAADNSPPLPPAPYSAATWSGASIPSPLGAGSNTMGTNPQPNFNLGGGPLGFSNGMKSIGS